MKTIACAFEGFLGRDAEIRTLSSGRRFLKLAVAVGEDEAREWLDVSAWSDHLVDLAPHLTKGVELYCEGSLKVRRWDASDGPRTTLQVSAQLIQPMGLIGHRKPKAARGAAKGKAKPDSQAPLDRMTAEPEFNDALPF